MGCAASVAAMIWGWNGRNGLSRSSKFPDQLIARDESLLVDRYHITFQRFIFQTDSRERYLEWAETWGVVNQVVILGGPTNPGTKELVHCGGLNIWTESEDISNSTQISGHATVYADRASYNGITVTVPFWVVLIIAGPSPLASFATGLVQRRKAKRGSRGQCLTYGYDMRATLHRCPECGAVPPKNDLVPSILSTRSGGKPRAA